jgi:prepilin-type N-terminal cleavage/methylation domain-containing protein
MLPAVCSSHSPTPLTSRSRGAFGFSLIELLVVLVILGIMAAMVAPRFSRAIDHAAVDSVLRQLRNDIAYTRTTAVRSGVRYQIRYHHVDVGGRPCITEYHIRPQQQPDSPSRRVPVAGLARGVCLSTSGNQITFDSRGLGTAGRTFTAERGSIRKRLVMNRIGRTRIER